VRGRARDEQPRRTSRGRSRSSRSISHARHGFRSLPSLTAPSLPRVRWSAPEDQYERPGPIPARRIELWPFTRPPLHRRGNTRRLVFGSATLCGPRRPDPLPSLPPRHSSRPEDLFARRTVGDPAAGARVIRAGLTWSRRSGCGWAGSSENVTWPSVAQRAPLFLTFACGTRGVRVPGRSDTKLPAPAAVGNGRDFLVVTKHRSIVTCRWARFGGSARCESRNAVQIVTSPCVFGDAAAVIPHRHRHIRHDHGHPLEFGNDAPNSACIVYHPVLISGCTGSGEREEPLKTVLVAERRPGIGRCGALCMRANRSDRSSVFGGFLK